MKWGSAISNIIVSDLLLKMEESEQKPITIKLVNKEGKTHEIVFDHKITTFGGILKTLEET